MNPAKIAAIILIISIGLIAVYSIGKNFLMPKNQLLAINASDNYGKQPEKLAIKSPIQWLENNQEISEPSGSLENKELTQQSEILPDINSKIQNFLNNIQVFKEENPWSNT